MLPGCHVFLAVLSSVDRRTKDIGFPTHLAIAAISAVAALDFEEIINLGALIQWLTAGHPTDVSTAFPGSVCCLAAHLSGCSILRFVHAPSNIESHGEKGAQRDGQVGKFCCAVYFYLA